MKPIQRLLKTTPAFLLGISSLLLLAAGKQAYGQIYEANNANSTIGEYTTSGGTVNASLVSGLHGPQGIAVSGGDVFVANGSTGTVGEYNAITGATINSSFISGLSTPFGIASLEEISLSRTSATARLANTTLLPGRQLTPRSSQG